MTRIGAICLLLLSFGVYGFFKARIFMAGPQITIISPANGQSVSEPLTSIAGKAVNVASLYLNGRKIFTDKDGNFAESLLLANGYNTIEVSGADKFNRKINKILELVYQ